MDMIERWLWAVVLMPGLLFTGCTKELEPRDLRRESEHFTFISTTSAATGADFDEGVERAEALYGAISAIVGPGNLPQRRIHVLLEGNFQSQGPYVDDEGRIRLYRYPDAAVGYYGLLAHELTHAFRYEFWHRVNPTWTTFLYFEEGFAEWMAMAVDPDRQGFPFFGYPEEAVAGHWVVTGQHIPHHVLRERHDDLNQPCEFQAYPERASWFRHVEDVYGRDAVLQIAYSEAETTSGVVHSMLGATLEQLDTEWELWVLSRYAAFDGAERLAAEYAAAIQGAHICVAGVDY